MMKEVIEFIEHAQLPVYLAPMAKGGIHEDHPQFRGIFAGNCSTEQVQKEIDEADLILSIGSMNSDFNTGGFSYRLSQQKTIGETNSVHCPNCLCCRISHLSYQGVLCHV
jgi:pyruvate decarboxylase